MNDWRNELIKDVTNAMFKVENMQCSKLLVMARAALAVAEPVIREQCAKICEGDFDAEMKGYGDYFATAIRKGGEDRYARG